MGKFEIKLTILFLLGTILLHPRLRTFLPFAGERNMKSNILSIPQAQAQSLWQSREFLSIGSSELLDSLPDNAITRSFPLLNNFHYEQIVSYTSPTVKSLDLVLNKKYSHDLAAGLSQQDLAMNKPTAFIKDNTNWLVAVFDQEQANHANGYFYENKFSHDYVWFHISMMK